MWRTALLALVTAGCNQLLGVEGVTGEGDDDAPIDGPADDGGATHDGSPHDGPLDPIDASTACPIVELSAPTCTPVERSFFVTDTPVQRGQTRGNIAYLAQYIQGLGVIDVTNPAAPDPLGATTGTAFDVTTAVSGSYVALAAGNTGLKVVDVSDPTDPDEVGQITMRDDATAIEAWRLTSAGPGAPIWVVDHETNRVTAFDISNPAAPEQIGDLALEDPSEARAVGDILYVASWTSGHGVDIFDVSDPENPALLANYPMDLNVYAPTIDGARAYVPNYNRGLIHVLDVTDPATPTCVAMLAIGAPSHVEVNGDRIAVAIDRGFGGAEGDLAIIDVEDPTEARLLGIWDGGKETGRAIHSWMFGPNGDTVLLSHIWNSGGEAGWGARLFDISSCD
jgi:hypothetical protein